MSQEELDIWLAGCLSYYNKYSSIKKNNMKNNEERIQQLEQAHSRLHNQFTTFHQDFIEHRNVFVEQINELKKLINAIQLPKEEEPQVLPENLITGKEYKATIIEVIKSTPVKWKQMDYTNWEIKLETKEQYVYIAFIPAGIVLAPNDVVKFTYSHPFQCRKLKLA